MASEIRVNKINSRTGVGTITLSPTGVDFTGIATVATLKATTGIVTTLSVTGTTTLNGNLDLQDNDKILVGTGDDLEIYHDGTHSYLSNGTGNLFVEIPESQKFQVQHGSEAIINGYADGRVELYHDNTKRLETTSDGVTITGTATATEGLVLDGQTGSGKGLRLDLAGSGDYIIQETTTNDVVQFGGTGASNFFVHNISSGRIGINTTTPNGDLHIGHLPTGSGNVNVVTLDRDDGTLIYGIDYNGSSNLVSFTGDNKQFAFANKSGSAEAVRILNTGGMTFNGDTAQANALDDYEEGTWTPTFTASTTNPVYSTSTVAGNYTKIGNTVTAWGLIIVNGVTSNGSGNWRVSGFPYNSSGQQYAQNGIIGYNDVQTNEVNKLYFVSGSSYAQIIPNGVTQSNATYNSNAITTGYFGITITYRTA